MLVSYGIIKNKKKIKKEYKFAHSCSTDAGSSGSPILMQNSNKIIGIHYGTEKDQEKDKEYNLANFLNEPIKKFIDKLNLEKEKEKTNSKLSNIKEPIYNQKNSNNVKINQRYTNEKEINDRNIKKEELKSKNGKPKNKSIDQKIEKNNLDKLMKNTYISQNLPKKMVNRNIRIINTSSKGNNSILPPIQQNYLKKNISMSSSHEKKRNVPK